MKLTLHGHDDRYAVEQLQLSLFPDNTEGEAASALHRGRVWLTAVTKITVNGVTAAATRRIKAADETVRLRRRAATRPCGLLCAVWQGFPPTTGSTPATAWIRRWRKKSGITPIFDNRGSYETDTTRS